MTPKREAYLLVFLSIGKSETHFSEWQTIYVSIFVEQLPMYRHVYIYFYRHLYMSIYIWTQYIYTEKFFRNHIESNRNQIVCTIFWLIWNRKRMRPLAVPNQSKNSKCNRILVRFNIFSKKFSVYIVIGNCSDKNRNIKIEVFSNRLGRYKRPHVFEAIFEPQLRG